MTVGSSGLLVLGPNSTSLHDLFKINFLIKKMSDKYSWSVYPNHIIIINHIILSAYYNAL